MEVNGVITQNNELTREITYFNGCIAHDTTSWHFLIDTIQIHGPVHTGSCIILDKQMKKKTPVNN